MIAAINKADDGTNTVPDLPTRPTGCSGLSNQEIAGKIKNAGDAITRMIVEAFERAMEAQTDTAEGQQQASEELVKALKAAWEWEPPGQEYINAVSDSVANYTACGLVVAACVRTKGKIAQVPGWPILAAGLGCTVVIDQLEIHYRDAGYGQDDDTLDDDGDEQPPPTTQPTTEPPRVPERITWDEVAKGLEDYNAGLITREEYRAIVNRWDCQNGWQPACQ